MASRRAGRKGGRHCVNPPASPIPTKVVKAKEQEVLKTSSPAPSAAVVKVKKEDVQNTKENCPDKGSSTLSAEEATDRFIAELKRDISMRMTSSGILIQYIMMVLKCVLLRC